MLTATAIAPANIAFIKYWGKKDPAINLPYNDSISMNLSDALTTTTVEYSADLTEDVLLLNSQPASPAQTEKVSRHLDLVRKLMPHPLRATVTTSHNFPTGAGIASSASGFAALSLAATAAAGLQLSEKELSILARYGSGSASRSIPNGFVQWKKGSNSLNSYAVSLYPKEYWDICDVVVIGDAHREKAVSSGEGHQVAATSPFFTSRIKYLRSATAELERALADRDFERFGTVTEQESFNLHAIMMTSVPTILYWDPLSVLVMQAVWAMRREGTQAYLTMDAGPHVHVICQLADLTAIKAKLTALEGVSSLLVNQAGDGARLG
jgi:diphosphomevalonate decarboxylase